MFKIAITTSSFDVSANPLLKTLESLGFEILQNSFKRRLTEQEVADFLSRDVVAMIAGVEPLTKNVISGAPSLRVISRCGIGLDNVDLIEAKSRGITVLNTPSAPSKAVAEHVLALMLNKLRRVAEADRSMRMSQWNPLMGRMMASQTIGIIGLGRIGNEVAKLVQGFGAKVVGYDIDKKAGSINSNILSISLEELFKVSDIVSLHVPYSDETHHMINSRTLKIMKKDAIIINVARGGLIDEGALFTALKDGSLSGAAIDVYEQEPYSGQLITLENILLTSHMGSYARESRVLQEVESVENLFKGMKIQGLVS